MTTDSGKQTPLNLGPECSEENCDRKVWARGMCSGHYRRWWKLHPGETTPQPRRRTPRPYTGPEPCEVPACTKDAQKFRRHCAMHAARLKRYGNLEGKRPRDRSVAEWFAVGCPQGLPADVCWEWTGTIRSTGYGSISHLYAHRVSYELHIGPIPDGLLVRHKCDNRPCVNPAHLEVGTAADNTRDMMERGRHRTAPNRNQRRWSAA